MAAIRISSEMFVGRLADCVCEVTQKDMMIEKANDPRKIIHMPLVKEKTRMEYIVFLRWGIVINS